jgi:selenide,water dikinase
VTEAAGRPGDMLVLTKPLGVGVAVTANAAGAAPPGLHEAAVASMQASNDPAADAAREAGVRCGTEVADLGLLGHLRELVAASGVGAVIRVDRLPVLEGAVTAAAGGHVPEAAARNRDEAGEWVDFDDSIIEDARTLMFDPQTSGGLLLAVPRERLHDLLAALGARGVQGATIGQLIPEPVGRIGVVSPVNRLGPTGGGGRTAKAPEGQGPPPPA